MSFDKEKANLVLAQFLKNRNDPVIKNQLVEIHTPLAIKIAFDFFKSFRRRFNEEDLPDLIQESCLGIFEALEGDKYDPKKSQIQTYIGWWCLAKCRMCLKKIQRANKLIFLDYKNNTWANDEYKNLYFIWDAYKLDPNKEDNHDCKYYKHLVLFFDSLPSREKEIFCKRFLLLPEITLEEIGKSLNLTKERIRQIESDLLLKLKDHFNGFDGFYYENISGNLSEKDKNVLTQFHFSLSEDEKLVFQERVLKFKPISRTKLSKRCNLALETIFSIEERLKDNLSKLLKNKEKNIEHRISL